MLLAVAAPLCGQAQYADWTSWANGLMATALLPWAWWGIRRVMLLVGQPLPRAAGLLPGGGDRLRLRERSTSVW